MADKTAKEKYPIFGDDFDLEDLPASFSGSSFICLEILGCNSRKAWSFSDARLDLQAYPESEIDAERKFVSTVNETIVFRGAVYDLLVNKNNNIQALHKIFESLGDFLTNGDHQVCLKQMLKDPKCEAAVQSTLALHLFQPLSGDAEVLVDEKVYKCSKVLPQCLSCKQPVNAGDTSFGYGGGWHGIADILLDQTCVKIETVKDKEESSTTQDYNVELEIGEPIAKRCRDHLTPGSADDNSSILTMEEVELQSNDNYMPHGPERLKFDDCKQSPTLSQVLAQTIVNAFYQVNEHPELQGRFIPTFLASEKYVTIHMYNPTLDVLLTQQKAMPLWVAGERLDYATILTLWIALNMHRFSKGLPNDSEDFESSLYRKSNFLALNKDNLRFYQSDIKRPYRLSSGINEVASTRASLKQGLYLITHMKDIS